VLLELQISVRALRGTNEAASRSMYINSKLTCHVPNFVYVALTLKGPLT
jgi:hypothetical protein